METIGLTFIVNGDSYIAELVFYSEESPRFFEVYNIRPSGENIYVRYKFIIDDEKHILACTQPFDKDQLPVTGAIEMAIRNLCEEMNLLIFE